MAPPDSALRRLIRGVQQRRCSQNVAIARFEPVQRASVASIAGVEIKRLGPAGEGSGFRVSPAANGGHTWPTVASGGREGLICSRSGTVGRSHGTTPSDSAPGRVCLLLPLGRHRDEAWNCSPSAGELRHLYILGYLYATMNNVAASLQPIHRRNDLSAAIQVYVTLRDAIVRVELMPGQQLSENELARQLRVSRTPVREALTRLRDERLIQVVRQLGTYVARISPSAVSDAQFIREALECAAIRVAAERAGEEDLRALEENLRGQERARDERELEVFYLLDDALHKALCDLSRHPSLWLVSQRMRSHLNRVRRLSLAAAGYLPEMIEEHREVVAAVAAHDPDRAELALRYHLRQVLRELPRIRAERPDFFEDDMP
jgi:DNA-binding GntR family transcriptional regulator